MSFEVSFHCKLVSYPILAHARIITIKAISKTFYSHVRNRFKKMIIFSINGKSVCHSGFLFFPYNPHCWCMTDAHDHNIQEISRVNLTINWIFDLLFFFPLIVKPNRNANSFMFLNIIYQNDHNSLLFHYIEKARAL